MNSELRYRKNPKTIKFYWSAFYAVIAGMIILGLLTIAGRIRTHTLPTGQIELSIPYSKYVVGEVVTFTLKNNFNSPAYIQNNCPNEPLAVYIQENNKWVRQHDVASVKDCPTESRQVLVPANGVVNGTFYGWHNLFNKPGKYRVVAFVEYYNSLPYQEIEIVAPKQIIKKTEDAKNEQTSITQQNQSATTAPVTEAPSYTAKQSKTVRTRRGTISVDYDAATIYVTAIAPAQGCVYEGGNSGSQVQVTFKCPSGETQVQLTLLRGQIVVNIENGGAAGD